MNNEGIIFIYGSLKVNGVFAYHFDKFRLKVENAQTKGLLYDLGGFPALVLPGKNYIYGELHTYSNFDKVIRNMDIIEGYAGEGSDNNLYKRRLIKVKTENDEIIETITYVLADKYLIELTEKGYVKEIINGIW